MLPYRERLSPSVWIYLSTALVIPASLLVFLPISPIAGAICAAVLYLGSIATLLITSPVITVDETGVTAGRAQLPIQFVGNVEVARGADATLQRGRELDARAWLVIRGWIDPVAKVAVRDPEDPAPYWLISSRRPESVSSAIAEAKSRAAARDSDAASH